MSSIVTESNREKTGSLDDSDNSGLMSELYRGDVNSDDSSSENKSQFKLKDSQFIALTNDSNKKIIKHNLRLSW
jgi:hypothetical protein